MKKQKSTKNFLCPLGAFCFAKFKFFWAIIWFETQSLSTGKKRMSSGERFNLVLVFMIWIRIVMSYQILVILTFNVKASIAGGCLLYTPDNYPLFFNSVWQLEDGTICRRHYSPRQGGWRGEFATHIFSLWEINPSPCVAEKLSLWIRKWKLSPKPLQRLLFQKVLCFSM